MSFALIDGCKAPLEIASNSVLDPCNCTTYYVRITEPKPDKVLRTCPRGNLWNHHSNQCEPLESVVIDGICDRKAPWDRCKDATNDSAGDGFRATMKSKCQQSGRYDQNRADMINDRSPVSKNILPVKMQHANIELMVASFVAGSVITLMLVAIVLTICGLPTVRLPSRLTWLKDKTKVTHKKKTKVSKKIKKGTPTPCVTEGDNVSVVYEDIEDEMDEKGYRHMVDSSQYQPTSSASAVQTTRVKITTTSTRHGSQSQNTANKVSLQPPKSSSIVTTNVSGPKIGTKLMLKPVATPPKPPPTNIRRTEQPKRPVPKPPDKSNVNKQISHDYIHPT